MQVNRTIWKYVLENKVFQALLLPPGAEIICVREQYGLPTLWAKTIPEWDGEKLVPRKIAMIGTGVSWIDEKESTLQYLGTCMFAGDQKVVHIFEYTGEVDVPEFKTGSDQGRPEPDREQS
jgi:hypothetical protein